jgi:hypothetical protein
MTDEPTTAAGREVVAATASDPFTPESQKPNLRAAALKTVLAIEADARAQGAAEALAAGHVYDDPARWGERFDDDLREQGAHPDSEYARRHEEEVDAKEAYRLGYDSGWGDAEKVWLERVDDARAQGAAEALAAVERLREAVEGLTKHYAPEDSGGEEAWVEWADLRAVVQQVITTLSHWPRDAPGHGWNPDQEPHSEWCPPCVLLAAIEVERKKATP